MRWSRLALLLVGLVLQTSFLPHIAPDGIRPDLLLVLAVLIGLNVAPRQATWWGALAGLLVDLSLGRFIGFNIAVKAVAGYAASIVGSKLYRHNLGVPAVIAGLATLLQELLMFWMLRVYGLELLFVPSFYRIIVPHALTNLIAAAVLGPLVQYAFAERTVAAEG